MRRTLWGPLEDTGCDTSGGAAVPNAKLTATHNERNQVIRTVTTDASGGYSANFLPIGGYSVNFEAPGFKTAARTGIVLNVNDVLRINMTMQVGAVSETVE